MANSKKLSPTQIQDKLGFYEMLMESFYENLIKMSKQPDYDNAEIAANNQGLAQAAEYLRDRLDSINSLYP